MYPGFSSGFLPTIVNSKTFFSGLIPTCVTATVFFIHTISTFVFKCIVDVFMYAFSCFQLEFFFKQLLSAVKWECKFISYWQVLKMAATSLIYLCKENNKNKKQKGLKLKLPLLFGCLCGVLSARLWSWQLRKRTISLRNHVTRWGCITLHFSF